MFCDFFGKCGGCAYLDISYESELAQKREALAEILGEYAELLDELHPAPTVEGYRNKMELAFGDDGPERRLALGIRKKRNFYEVANPENCVLICDDFKRVVKFAVEFFRESGEMFFHRKRHTGTLRHLVLRRGEFTGEILVLLSTASGVSDLASRFANELQTLPIDGKIVGILHSENDGVADAVKNENVKILHGNDYYNELLCGLKFKVSMFSFFQTNSRAAEVLYEVVRKFALTGAIALDLYCGTGTIAQIISSAFDKVVGVEIVEEAIHAARENAQMNGITNCEFHAGDTFALLENLLKNEHADTIIVDPPRDGLHPKALAKIAALPAPRLVYVSCKPKSLTRDIPTLIEAGYTLVKIEAVDMFPRTPHMEAIALLRRADT